MSLEYEKPLKSETWHENGQLKKQKFLLNGKLEGELKEWYENGLISKRKYKAL
jgi:antitoxin component YwqK of YwqJK toxin-antitoxin module